MSTMPVPAAARRLAIDGPLYPGAEFSAAPLSAAADGARRLEAGGFDGAYVVEGVVDPFLSLGVAATATTGLTLTTGVAIAFARSPMVTALQAWNLHELSGGRLVLGLGSQVQAHIEKRFSMPWGPPASRMRDYVGALRAIWDCWGRGRPLQYRGEFYEHTLMTPTWNPGPIDHPDPRIFIGALGPRMVAVAAEVADGLFGHPFSSLDFIRDHQLPALERGYAARSPALGSRVEVAAMPLVVTGRDADERAAAEQAVRKLCAFYGSTPAYHRVLEYHGRPDLGPRLNAMSKRGEWDAMTELFDDDLLGAMTVSGTPEQVPALVAEWCAGVVDRVALYAPYPSDQGMWQSILAGFRALPAARTDGHGIAHPL